MNERNPIAIEVWTEKSKALLEKVRDLFVEIGFDGSGLPQEVFEGNKPVSLVFAGQYSAGKSTILKALTRIEGIATGAGITTQEAHTYDWNGIKVIDTPGIHTTLRPDHDEISYQAIADADMLVYVVTQELFDDSIGQNFRRLLREKDKAGEMILIVNKMADIGNTAENQETKLKDLEKVTSPYTPAQLRTVFVDAESYLDSLSEEDVEIRRELRERSNYDVLVSTLNEFVRDKGISSKMTTVLYQLFEFLQRAIEHYQPSTGDNDIDDALEEHLLQERSVISTMQWRIETAVKSIIEKSASKIREQGHNIANTIYDYKTETEANDAINTACNEVNTITAACVDSVTHKIEELSQDCQVQLDGVYKSDFSQSLKFRLESKDVKSNPIVERILKSDVLSQVLSKGSKGLIDNTIGNAAKNGLGNFSGSNMHDMALKIGHLFGHKFEPWEAVKFTKGLNVAGKVLGACGFVLSVAMQAKEDIDADKQQQEMRANRQKLRADFDSAANAVVEHFNNALDKFLSENYLTRISGIDSQISEIKNMREGKSKTCKLLKDTQTECRSLIRKMMCDNKTLITAFQQTI